MSVSHKSNLALSQLVSWCFEPSQPQRITSGLSQTVNQPHPRSTPCGSQGDVRRIGCNGAQNEGQGGCGSFQDRTRHGCVSDPCANHYTTGSSALISSNLYYTHLERNELYTLQFRAVTLGIRRQNRYYTVGGKKEKGKNVTLVNKALPQHATRCETTMT